MKSLNNLKWITHNYPNLKYPKLEIQNLSEVMNIIKEDGK